MKDINKYHFLFLAILLLMTNSCNKVKNKKTDWNVSLKQNGKNPYDTYLAWQSVKLYFPDALVNTIYSNYDFTQINQAHYQSQEGHVLLALVGRSINFSDKEWKELLQFMRSGNEIVILASTFDSKITEEFHFDVNPGKIDKQINDYYNGADNLNALSLIRYPNQYFGYQGRDIKGYFVLNPESDNIDSESSLIDFSKDLKPKIIGQIALSGDTLLKPNFIQFGVGAGHLTVLASPLIFSNYFLLKKRNLLYLDNVWQNIEGDIFQIYWMNFDYRNQDQSAFLVLWKNKSTRWALIVLMILGSLFLLFSIKRRQRVIPIIESVSNSSAEFVETIGLLYYNKGDNYNLALKMEQHFLEWIRVRFNMSTNILDRNFEIKLSNKSGMPIGDIESIMAIIHQIRIQKIIFTDQELFDFYTKVQQFYKAH